MTHLVFLTTGFVFNCVEEILFGSSSFFSWHGPNLTIILWSCSGVVTFHYNDVIIDAIASQINSLTIVYSTVYSDTDQRKHQRSASLAFVRGIHWGPVNSPHKWPVTRFHLMTSSCLQFDHWSGLDLYMLSMGLLWKWQATFPGYLSGGIVSLTANSITEFIQSGLFE